jgi:hypothetical protein
MLDDVAVHDVLHDFTGDGGQGHWSITGGLPLSPFLNNETTAALLHCDGILP